MSIKSDYRQNKSQKYMHSTVMINLNCQIGNNLIFVKLFYEYHESQMKFKPNFAKKHKAIFI